MVQIPFMQILYIVTQTALFTRLIAKFELQLCESERGKQYYISEPSEISIRWIDGISDHQFNKNS